MNLLRDSQNGLVNDTQKLAKGLNLTQNVLHKHRAELDELHISMSRLKVGLNSVNEEFLYLLKRSSISYVIVHIDYLLDRLTECAEILHSQISQLHDILRVVTNGCITPSVVSPKEIKSIMDEIAHKIPIDMQMGFKSDFDIWHVYKYSVTTLILHGNEIHLIMEIPLAD